MRNNDDKVLLAIDLEKYARRSQRKPSKPGKWLEDRHLARRLQREEPAFDASIDIHMASDLTELPFSRLRTARSSSITTQWVRKQCVLGLS